MTETTIPDLAPESRFTPPTSICPSPQNWSSTDSDSTELEVSLMVGGLIRGLQPQTVFESGSAFGQTSLHIGQALHDNGHGNLVTCEVDNDRAAITRDRCRGLPVSVITGSSIDVLSNWHQFRVGDRRGPQIDFAWLDSLFPLRPQELELISPLMAPLGIVGIHDAGYKYAEFRDEMVGLARSLEGWSAIEFPTPRGLLLLGTTLTP